MTQWSPYISSTFWRPQQLHESSDVSSAQWSPYISSTLWRPQQLHESSDVSSAQKIQPSPQKKIKNKSHRHDPSRVLCCRHSSCNCCRPRVAFYLRSTAEWSRSLSKSSTQRGCVHLLVRYGNYYYFKPRENAWWLKNYKASHNNLFVSAP